MPKGRPDFTDDLKGIQDDVVKDVGNILELAHAARRESPARENAASSAPPEPASRQGQSSRPKNPRPDQAPVANQPSALVNVTTRLSHQTNELLTEAALRQRLKKISPASRQDIMEVAIQEWCQKNGYSR